MAQSSGSNRVRLTCSNPVADAGFQEYWRHVAFLMKDLVLLAASFYLLRHDVLRAAYVRVS